MKRPSERITKLIKGYPMVIVSLCLILGILISRYFEEDGYFIYPLFVSLVIVGFVVDYFYRRAIVFLWVAVAILGYLLADYHSYAYDIEAEYDTEKLYIAEVESREQIKINTASKYKYSQRVRLIAERDSLGHLTVLEGSAMCYLDTSLLANIGDTIAYRGKLRKVSGGYGDYLRRSGIIGNVYGYSASILSSGRDSFWRFCEGVRLEAENKIFALYCADSTNQQTAQSLAIMCGMVVGTRTFISEETTEDYRKVGASHLLAISGLHIGIIVAILNFLFGFIRIFGTRGRAVYSIIIILLLWSYALFSGMALPVQRAAIMFTLYQIGVIANRRSFGLNLLGTAAAIILLIEPLSLFDIGFQLSFAAMVGISIFYRPLSYLCRSRYYLVRIVSAAVCVSIAAQLAVAPLIVYWFGTFQWFAIVLSVVLWLSVPLIIFCTLGYLVTSIYAVGSIATLVTTWQNNLFGYLSEFSWVSIDGININGWTLFLAYITIGIIGYLLNRYTNKKSRQKVSLNKVHKGSY